MGPKGQATPHEGCPALPSTGFWDSLYILKSGHQRDVPKSPMSYASVPGVHLITVYHGMRWDSVECPTEFHVPSHPMVHWDEMDT